MLDWRDWEKESRGEVKGSTQTEDPGRDSSTRSSNPGRNMVCGYELGNKPAPGTRAALG